MLSLLSPPPVPNLAMLIIAKCELQIKRSAASRDYAAAINEAALLMHSPVLSEFFQPPKSKAKRRRAHRACEPALDCARGPLRDPSCDAIRHVMANAFSF